MQKGNLATIAVDAQTTTKKQKKQKFGGFSDEELRDCFTLKENCISDTKTKLGNKWFDYGKIFFIIPLKILHVNVYHMNRWIKWS